MSRLLPPLETLSQKHPEVFIQELSSNLRAVIATHGAYLPEDLTASPAQCSKGSEETPRNNSVPLKKRHKEQTEANNSQTKPHSPPMESSTPGNFPIRHPVCSSGSAAALSSKDGGKVSVDDDPSTKTFSDWLLEACDPDVPTRAFALRALTKMMQKRDADACQAQEKVLIVSLYLFLVLFLGLTISHHAF